MKICLNKICIFFILFFITSCGVKKNVVKELESININDVVSQINSNKINSNWLYIKGKIKMISNNDKVTLGVSMKIRQDSLIWLSISAPIIGEINRVMLTPDSLYVINRTNSTWLIKPIKQLKNQFGVSLSYSDIQAFLSSNIRIPVEQIKNENRVLPLYPITSVVNHNDLLIKDNIDSVSYLINTDYKFINEININYSQKQKLIIKYSDYSDGYPKRLNVFISKPELNVELLYNKVEEREIDKVSFKIPQRYEEVN
jgi:hypothetical protein